MRAEARNLITQLPIGSFESKNSTMDSLLGLLSEDDKNVIISVAQGVVPVFVRLLDSSSSMHGSKSRYRSLTRRVTRHIGIGVSVRYRAIRKIR